MIVRIVRLSAALLVVNGLLVLPRWLAPGTFMAVWVALEAGFVVGLFLLLPASRSSRIAARVAAVALVGIGLLGIAGGVSAKRGWKW